jgi:hypothetical protein
MDHSGHATELGHDRSNVLPGAVVNHDSFDGTPRLACNAGESPPKQIAAVVDRDYDAHQVVLAGSMNHIGKARAKGGGKRPIPFQRVRGDGGHALGVLTASMPMERALCFGLNSET